MFSSHFLAVFERENFSIKKLPSCLTTFLTDQKNETGTFLRLTGHVSSSLLTIVEKVTLIDSLYSFSFFLFWRGSRDAQ